MQNPIPEEMTANDNELLGRSIVQAVQMQHMDNTSYNGLDAGNGYAAIPLAVFSIIPLKALEFFRYVLDKINTGLYHVANMFGLRIFYSIPSRVLDFCDQELYNIQSLIMNINIGFSNLEEAIYGHYTKNDLEVFALCLNRHSYQNAFNMLKSNPHYNNQGSSLIQPLLYAAFFIPHKALDLVLAIIEVVATATKDSFLYLNLSPLSQMPLAILGFCDDTLRALKSLMDNITISMMDDEYSCVKFCTSLVN